MLLLGTTQIGARVGHPRERRMKDVLIPKSICFFQMRFSRVVKQFSAQGYPPPGEYATFIDCASTLDDLPPD